MPWLDSQCNLGFRRGLGLLAVCLFVFPWFLPAHAAQAQEDVGARTPQPPIVDLHFHPAPHWDIDALVAAFDEIGVARAGNGPIGPDDVARPFLDRYPDRFIRFAGQGPINNLVSTQGESVVNLENAGARNYLNGLDATLHAGGVQGIGELFANNLGSHPVGTSGSRYLAESPLMRRLWDLSSRFGVPLSVHMEAEPASVASMERLLNSSQDGVWIWAHAGTYGEPPLLRELFGRHSNLYAELSWREGLRVRGLAPLGPVIPIADLGGQLRPDWLDLLEEFSDRFVIGTDVDQASPAGDTIASYILTISRWRDILAQLSPDTVERLAHYNAEHILGLRESAAAF